MLEINGSKFNTVDDFDFKGKRVLVRVDFNSPLRKGKVQMNERIRDHSLTIKELSEKGARVVVLAHQGRPGKDYMESLEQHAGLASDFVDMKYLDDLTGNKALEKINGMKAGEVLLLKNVRSCNEEFEPYPENSMVKKLAPLFDFFVSDAFSVAHRNQASIVSFASVLKSCVGRVMEKELEALRNLKSKKMLYILGGSKPEDNLVLVEDEKVNKVLSTGVFSLLCLEANGYNLGRRSFERGLLGQAKKFLSKIEVPLDLAVNDGGRKEIGVEQLPVDMEIWDIGKRTVEFYAREIKKAEAVFLKGPAGKFEEKGFEKGTVEILRTIAESDCFSLIGGGHSSHVLEAFSLRKDKFSHVSLAGGALIAYLAGKKLPGLEALKVK